MDNRHGAKPRRGTQSAIRRKMKKEHIVFILFFVYVIMLLMLAGQFEIHEQNSMHRGLLSGWNMLFRYVTISFLSSAAFLIIAYFIHNKLSVLFILLAPFLNVATAFAVGLLLNLIFWVTQLEEAISDFQKIFLISTISTLITTLWLLGDMFKKGSKRRGNRPSNQL